VLARVAGPTGFLDWLLNTTGSQLPDRQRRCYRTLFSDPAHLRGAMSFMAAADLPALLPACAALRCPASFVLGERDAWIPEGPLRELLARRLPDADLQSWPGGHLVHEELPARAAERVLALL
jgi:magnesium chelatase accessory protein